MDSDRPRLGLGCLAWSGAYGPVGTRRLERALHCALDLGATVLDLADFSADGAGLRRVGRALAARRSQATLAVHLRPCEPGSDPNQALDRVLGLLGVDEVDLCFVSVTGGPEPIEDPMAVLSAAVSAGKVRGLGVAGGSADELRRAAGVHPLAAVAVEHSLLYRADSVVSAADELGAWVMACGPLARGVLAARFLDPSGLPSGDARRGDPRFQPAQLAEAHRRLRRLQDVAAELDIGTVRLALAWLLAQSPRIVPVPGSTDCVHVEMNAAASATLLSPEVLALLEAEFPAEGVPRPVAAGEARAREWPPKPSKSLLGFNWAN